MKILIFIFIFLISQISLAEVSNYKYGKYYTDVYAYRNPNHNLLHISGSKQFCEDIVISFYNLDRLTYLFDGYYFSEFLIDNKTHVFEMTNVELHYTQTGENELEAKVYLDNNHMYCKRIFVDDQKYRINQYIKYIVHETFHIVYGKETDEKIIINETTIFLTTYGIEKDFLKIVK